MLRLSARALVASVVMSAVVGVTGTVMAPAAAAASVPTTYPAGASSAWFLGSAFDTCTAPSLSQMRAWKASPYGGVAIYVGGPNRGCSQPNLTSTWTRTVTREGWKLIPIYVGLQAPCATRTTFDTITPSRAQAQGTASAVDAVARLRAVGLQAGSIVYADMESYRADGGACTTAVLTYLSAFTDELHRRGYLSGVYGRAASTIGDLSRAHDGATFSRPDAIWLAEWDGVPSLTGFAGVPATSWSRHQRVKQYLGDHYETHGGVRLRIDSNVIDAPVASAARWYRSTARATVFTAPTAPRYTAGTLEKGVTVRVVCQTPGILRSGTRVWNKLTDGRYISDHLVDTGPGTGFDRGLPRCLYPNQVSRVGGTTSRVGPGLASAPGPRLAAGALTWTMCQVPTTEAGSAARIWNRMQNARFVPDIDVASPNPTTYSATIPRC